MDFERLAGAGLVHRRPIDFNTVAEPSPDSMADAALTASVRRPAEAVPFWHRGARFLAVERPTPSPQTGPSPVESPDPAKRRSSFFTTT
jgi:hypothetical protein